jgi:uncharacterized protein YciI
MYYALHYDTVEGFAERRQPYRAEHLALVSDAHARGRLVLAGALKPIGGEVDAALLIFKSDTAADVESFVSRDPYVINGLVTNWRVREWAVVVGG